jgi:hypothetical protein
MSGVTAWGEPYIRGRTLRGHFNPGCLEAAGGLKKPEGCFELLYPVTVSEEKKSKPNARSWLFRWEAAQIPHKMNWSKGLRRIPREPFARADLAE